MKLLHLLLVLMAAVVAFTTTGAEACIGRGKSCLLAAAISDRSPTQATDASRTAPWAPVAPATVTSQRTGLSATAADGQASASESGHASLCFMLMYEDAGGTCSSDD